MEARKASAWNAITRGETYTNGAWRTLSYGEAYVSSAWRQIVSFIQPLTLAVGGSNAASTDPSMAGNVSATPSGGLGPFTYVWTITGTTNLSSSSIASPAAASTAVNVTVNEPVGTAGHATLHCVVTDSLGTVASGSVTISFTYFTGPGGTE